MLVAIPLLGQLIFISALVLVLGELEQQVIAEKTSKAISTECSFIVSSSYIVLVSIVNAGVEPSKKDFHLRFYDPAKAERQDHLQKLKKLEPAAANREAVAEFLLASEKLTTSVEFCREELSKGKGIESLFASLRITDACQRQINSVLVAQGACPKAS